MDDYTKLCVEEQKEYCKTRHVPCFAPSDGRCFRCGRPIYSTWPNGGYKLEDAQSTMITNCPYCRWSFCD